MRQKRHRIGVIAIVCASFVTLAGCQKGMIRVSEIAPSVQIVADRHDAYVEADTTLSDTERRIYLRSTSLLREIVAEAEAP
jgi:hypothetical protein